MSMTSPKFLRSPNPSPISSRTSSSAAMADAGASHSTSTQDGTFPQRSAPLHPPHPRRRLARPPRPHPRPRLRLHPRRPPPPSRSNLSSTLDLIRPQPRRLPHSRPPEQPSPSLSPPAREARCSPFAALSASSICTRRCRTCRFTISDEQHFRTPEQGRGQKAWERDYADERSWESLQEDESGLLFPIDTKSLVHAQYRRRLLLRSSAGSASARIQKGLIRYLYVVLDLSRAAAETDYRPTRMAVVAKCAETFMREFLDQNPLSHIGLVTIKDGVAQCLTELGGTPDSQIKALMGKLECSGDASLQNALELVHETLSQIPSYGHREVLIFYSALNTCDPGDIMETIKKCKSAKIRCSVVGLSAEVFICKHLCEETGGSYTVALDESHFKELLLEHAPPPPAIAEYALSSLIKMGFPQRGAEGVISICSCHKEVKVGGGYTCPRCKARLCELPTECRICGLTLVSSPHLARSYHHLFPVTPFNEVQSTLSRFYQKAPQTCFGCQQNLMIQGSNSSQHVSCPKCNQHFCLDCDIYIHESLHNCPGCESQRNSTT